MNEVDQSSVTAGLNDPPVQSKRRRWRRRLAIALLIALPLLRIAWLFRSRDVRDEIEIGPTTTFVSEPRTPDGFVDFSGAVNAKAGDGVTPENNAAVLLNRAYGPALISPAERDRYFELLGIPPLPDDGKYLVDDRQFLQAQGVAEHGLGDVGQQFLDELNLACSRPWTDEEFPQVAAFLAANEAPLELIVKASRQTRYYSPIATQDAVMLAVMLPLEQRSRWAARLLILRAMRRLAHEDVPGAWEDILACFRVARLAGQSPNAIGLLVSYALEAFATSGAQALIRSDRLSAAQARQCLRDLDALPPPGQAADVIDFGERLTTLDSFCRLATDQLSPQPGEPRRSRAISTWRMLDWNVVLRQINQHIDEMVGILRLPDPHERAAAQESFETRLAPSDKRWRYMLGAFLGVNGELSKEIEKPLLGLMSPAQTQVRTAQMRTEARIDLSRIGFALAAYQSERGTYPQALTELAPEYLAAVPPDPCTGADFVYRTAGDGFVLYSVGDNLVDDGGASYDDDPQGDDLVLRVGAE